MKKVIQRIISTGADLSTKKALKNTLKFLGIEESNIDKLYVELKNDMNRDSFSKTDSAKKAVFIPQCLRKPGCKAELNEDGYKCIECNKNKCKVYKIKKMSEPLGYRFFIVPGGSMVEKLIVKYKPEAVLGVGCINELVMAMEGIPIPTQGVELTKDGCVATDVNLKEVKKVLSKT